MQSERLDRVIVEIMFFCVEGLRGAAHKLFDNGRLLIKLYRKSNEKDLFSKLSAIVDL